MDGSNFDGSSCAVRFLLLAHQVPRSFQVFNCTYGAEDVVPELIMERGKRGTHETCIDGIFLVD